ncbi:MAG: glycosyltransferase family 2 protein [Dehalococcoidia bacterium]|nr:glycosyltransferase family 2 protein [Dehalococcoidia bacterium]
MTPCDTYISVIIPVYNQGRTFRQCLESVYGTKYHYMEVIVIDDCSSDQCSDIVAQFPCQLIRLRENMGPAYARNRGAENARGEILLFTDSDVCLHEDTMEMVAREFESKPDLSAVFGSYDKHGACYGFFSVYKNLVHHYGHQTAREEASTFWTGCGAIRKAVFDEMGGFDEGCRTLEDIELGYRLFKRGHRILLNKQIQVTHSKEYTFFSLIRSDVRDRAIPWTKLMLRERVFRNDLSTKSSSVLSTIAAFLALFALASIGIFWYSIYLFTLSCIGFLVLNLPFYRFILKERGALFAMKSVFMNYLSYLYSGVGLVIGISQYFTGALVRRLRLARTR